MRGTQLIDKFLRTNYNVIDGYLSEIGRNTEVLSTFDKIYETVESQQLN